MTLLACPRDRTPLDGIGGGVHHCATCHHDYVVSITDAYTTHTGWNRNAIGAGAVQAVLDATTPRQENTR